MRKTIKSKKLCFIDQTLKMMIRRERFYLSPANGILIQRKIVEIFSKKENDPKITRSVVNFYRILSLLNNGINHI